METKIPVLCVVFVALSSRTRAANPCAGSADPVACGRATLLRGQSHIGIPSACFSRVDAGPCSQDLIRIYFDSKTFTCKAFSYSGCGGNANRFVSVKNCYKLCHPYYRQRFVSLGSDSGVAPPALPAFSPKKGSDEPDSEESAALERSKTTTTTDEMTTATADKSTTAGAETTTAAEDPEAAAVDKGKMSDRIKFFSSAGEQSGEMPEVVHEVDAFAASGQLQNVQHEAYAPVGGYVPTRDGQFRQQVVDKQKIFYTKYK